MEHLHLKLTSWERAFSEIDLSSISGNIFLIKERRLSFDLNRSSLKELISLHLSSSSETSKGSVSFFGKTWANKPPLQMTPLFWIFSPINTAEGVCSEWYKYEAKSSAILPFTNSTVLVKGSPIPLSLITFKYPVPNAFVKSKEYLLLSILTKSNSKLGFPT